MTIKPSKILIFGEALVDLFPEQTMIGGAPYNVARHLQSFDLAPIFLTKIGTDADGDRIFNEMQAQHMQCDGVLRDAVYPTGQVKVTFTPNGHQFEILPQQAYDFMQADEALKIRTLFQPDMFYLGTLALRSPQTQHAAQQLLAHITCSVFCDINLRAPWYSLQTIDFALSHANIVKINHEELAEIANLLGIKGTPEIQARLIQQQYALDYLLITLGEHGSWCLNPSAEFKKVQHGVLKTPFIDSVGAGDAYSAVVMLGLLEEWPEDSILQRASDFSAAMCGIRGATPVNKDFYQAFLTDWLR